MDTDKFSDHYLKIINASVVFCKENNHKFLRSHHILYGITLVSDSLAYKILSVLGVDFEKIQNTVINQASTNPNTNNQVNISNTADDVLSGAYCESQLLKHPVIDSVHLLLALLHQNIFTSAQLLRYYDITYSKVRMEFNKIANTSVNIFLPPNKGKFVEYFYKFYPDNLIWVFEALIEDELIRYTQKDALNDKFDLQIQIDKFFGLHRFIDKVDYESNEFYENALKYIPDESKILFGSKSWQKL